MALDTVYVFSLREVPLWRYVAPLADIPPRLHDVGCYIHARTELPSRLFERIPEPPVDAKLTERVLSVLHGFHEKAHAMAPRLGSSGEIHLGFHALAHVEPVAQSFADDGFTVLRLHAPGVPYDRLAATERLEHLLSADTPDRARTRDWILGGSGALAEPTGFAAPELIAALDTSVEQWTDLEERLVDAIVASRPAVTDWTWPSLDDSYDVLVDREGMLRASLERRGVRLPMTSALDREWLSAGYYLAGHIDDVPSMLTELEQRADDAAHLAVLRLRLIERIVGIQQLCVVDRLLVDASQYRDELATVLARIAPFRSWGEGVRKRIDAVEMALGKLGAWRVAHAAGDTGADQRLAGALADPQVAVETLSVHERAHVAQLAPKHLSARALGELQIEAELATDPDDVAVLAVIADLLEQRGDPRGELIAIELALRGASPDRATQLAARRDELRAQLTPPAELRTRCTWGIGFVRRAEIVLDGPSDLAELVRHPSMRVLREIRVVPRPVDATLLYADLARLGRSLRRLELENLAAAHYVVEIAARLPRLVELRVAGRAQTAGLAHAQLRRLELAYGDPRLALRGLVPDALPSLRELALDARDVDFSDLGDETCAELASTGCLAQLERLELSAFELSSTGLDALARGLDGRRLSDLVVDVAEHGRRDTSLAQLMADFEAS